MVVVLLLLLLPLEQRERKLWLKCSFEKKLGIKRTAGPIYISPTVGSCS